MTSVEARAELQAWYLERLQPKLAQAARTGTVEARGAAACDAHVRRFLDISSNPTKFG